MYIIMYCILHLESRLGLNYDLKFARKRCCCSGATIFQMTVYVKCRRKLVPHFFLEYHTEKIYVLIFKYAPYIFKLIKIIIEQNIYLLYSTTLQGICEHQILNGNYFHVITDFNLIYEFELCR